MERYSVLNNVVFLDIETTGLDASNDKIIEIGAVKIKDKQVSRFSTLVNPHISVSLNILDLCEGITEQQLQSAPELDQVMKELLSFIEDFPLVCHNAAFEQSFLKIDNKFLDSLELIAILFPELPEFNLQYVIQKFLTGNRQEKHRGLSDSEDTLAVLNYAVSDFFYENGYTLPISITELTEWNWYKYLEKVDIDDVKYFLEDKPFTYETKLSEEYPDFALKDYEKLFKREDIWRRNGKSYSFRPQQKEASKFVREGLEKGKITIMEAPTGLGKSMAYLLPSAIYSHLKQSKVIISTNTKGLQNQLVEKDIPNVLDALNLKKDVKYTLIKGKSNYLCFERFEEIEFPRDLKTLLGYVYLKRFMREKGLGDSEEISYAIQEKFNLNNLMEQCYCDSELCEINSCAYKDSCFYASKVEDLRESQLIVVNHSLLLRWPYQNIAPLDNILVDEAHNLTQEVYDAFETSLISYEFDKLLEDIYDSNKKRGYLYYLSKKVKKETLPLKEIQADMEQCVSGMKNVQNAFKSYIYENEISREYNIKQHLNVENVNLEPIFRYLGYIKEDISSLSLDLDKALAVLKNMGNLEKDKRLKILSERLEVMNSYTRLLESMLSQQEEDSCFYFEVDKSLKWWKVSVIPLDVSGIFYDRILSTITSCLFISATLCTDNGYKNLKNTLGINFATSQNKQIIEVPPISPVFDYKGRSAIYAMSDMEPNDDIQTFSEEMKDFVLELLNIVGGNIIILFTSRRRLVSFKQTAAERLSGLGVRLIEGKKDISKLKSRKERYIFIGSKGFFEGVDIPGDSMTTVVLDKVPNINSKEPFYKSLIDNEAKKGKSYWHAYANVNMPIVSIDLKQIYGRLIRTEYDYGALFIMSKFDSGNSMVRKLEQQLHQVPIIRKPVEESFKDLKNRVMRWKQMNLYKILKEVQQPLKKVVSDRKKYGDINSLEETENFINQYISFEYDKRKLYYDVHISIIDELNIYISGRKIGLGKNRKSIEEYFDHVINFV
ncbi:exonuclease domain-containing protein [Clostridium oryzae]|uniref:Helicase ATP-binding domain-containing protein n=1 Tax=Clostridium oryzae TaxID=1450648 RepID=A0A1V4II82_9CLOT|nr:exonuclease domain-containing protein [Clostridium oryzae]OPJ59721.1 hypothetical protein CLORY_31690 [Clostridium oryzae]